MLKGKNKEYIISNYILQSSELLFEKSISDIQIKERGNIVELILYYKPSSKFETWKLKKWFYKEPQYITTFIKNGMLCAKFYAPSKFKDLIICKMHTINLNFAENRIFDYVKQKNPGRSNE